MKKIFSIRNIFGFLIILIAASILTASTYINKKAKDEKKSFSISKLKKGFRTPLVFR